MPYAGQVIKNNRLQAIIDLPNTKMAKSFQAYTKSKIKNMRVSRIENVLFVTGSKESDTNIVCNFARQKGWPTDQSVHF